MLERISETVKAMREVGFRMASVKGQSVVFADQYSIIDEAIMPMMGIWKLKVAAEAGYIIIIKDEYGKIKPGMELAEIPFCPLYGRVVKVEDGFAYMRVKR